MPHFQVDFFMLALATLYDTSVPVSGGVDRGVPCILTRCLHNSVDVTPSA